MVLMVVKYNESKKITRQEVVDPAHERFAELVKLGIEEVKLAAEDERLGLLKSIKKFSFTESKEKIEKEISYSDNDGKNKIIDFAPFQLRGYKVQVEDSKYGDILAVDIGNTKVALVDRKQSNDLIYAIRTVQNFNEGLVEEITLKEPDEKNQGGFDNDHA